MNMCKGMADWLEEEREEGRAEGRAEGMSLTKRVFKMRFEGKKEDEIARLCDIPLDEVRRILE